MTFFINSSGISNVKGEQIDVKEGQNVKQRFEF